MVLLACGPTETVAQQVGPPSHLVWRHAAGVEPEAIGERAARSSRAGSTVAIRTQPATTAPSTVHGTSSGTGPATRSSAIHSPLSPTPATAAASTTPTPTATNDSASA